MAERNDKQGTRPRVGRPGSGPGSAGQGAGRGAATGGVRGVGRPSAGGATAAKAAGGSAAAASAPSAARAGQHLAGATNLSVAQLRTSGISAARAAAYAVLERVASTDAHSDDLLHGPLLTGMTEVDRNLATALVLETLRWEIALDTRLAGLLSRPDAELGLPVRIALRLGAVQLLHFDRLPAHAAINESVELVRASGHVHASGMVNAVLRRLTREPAPGRKLHESVAGFAERLGHPAWLVERWALHYGRAVALSVCEYDQREPVAGGLFAAEPENPAVGADAPLTMPWMDDGSRLVAELAAAALPRGSAAGGEIAPVRVWDCCAAPGGKSVVLGRRLASQDVAIEHLATDLNSRRVTALRARLERELPGARVEQADASALPESFGEFDLILCDVPCSGTGTLARNPEIRHRLQLADLRRQAERQRAILAGALRRLRPGGRLVYSTCSLEPEENEAVVAAVAGREFARVDMGGLLGTLSMTRELPGVVRDGCLRTLPGANFAGDGFFAAVLERTLEQA